MAEKTNFAEEYVAKCPTCGRTNHLHARETASSIVLWTNIFQGEVINRLVDEIPEELCIIEQGCSWCGWKWEADTW